MLYAEVRNGEVQKTFSRPKWIDSETGDELTDSQLIQREGIYPVHDNPPAFDKEKENLETLSIGNWVVHSDYVEKTFNVTDKTVDERKKYLKRKARSEYGSAMRGTFAYNSANWSAKGEQRQRLVEHMARINAGKGLPNGKTTLTVTDADGNKHDLDSTQIVELATAGDDFVDANDDNYASLLSEIEAASSHDDLDAIDVTAGWA